MRVYGREDVLVCACRRVKVQTFGRMNCIYTPVLYQYNALWAMNERAQERCRRVTCTAMSAESWL